MISGYSKTSNQEMGYFSNGLIDNVCKVFDEMHERKDVAYSAMVFWCSWCYDIGRSIHSQLVEDSVSIDLDFGTAFIDFYAKCGDIEKAKDIVGTMRHKDVVTWSAMILGLATNGENETAIHLFEEMEHKGPFPNGITFVVVLVACNHKNLLNKARCLLGKMSKVYNMQPTIEHYGCMIDLLARYGQLKETEILIKLMPMAPDGAIWGSFLHGCLTHNEIHLAETGGKHVLSLEPNHSGRYVVLANMYANKYWKTGRCDYTEEDDDRKEKLSLFLVGVLLESMGLLTNYLLMINFTLKLESLMKSYGQYDKSTSRMSSATFTAPVTGSVCVGLNPNESKLFQTTNLIPWSRKTVSNGSRIHCMKVWNPINNKKFETLSYLPPLADESIAKEIDYMMKKGWIPCLEFDSVGHVFRENSRIPNYYDGRYWTMWKLPMFGCTDSSQVLNEIQECKKTYPNAYIRCLAFDNVKQAQCMSFVIQKPITP
ncbi:hypothetical protein E3N88_05829 [Mikania micrantha]|uniref:Ribulose bisphosphate carboxylase small subunit, chloroplastic n=1 Tax=Mikania micrantha TaxID=192012 RepID=A0A5N6PM22_9ASTR|nr:hypothetical protein E3N88_05829 [Mikania micrantha]